MTEQHTARTHPVGEMLRKAVLALTGFALLTHGISLYAGYVENMNPPKWSLVIIGLFLLVEAIDRD